LGSAAPAVFSQLLAHPLQLAAGQSGEKRKSSRCASMAWPQPKDKCVINAVLVTGPNRSSVWSAVKKIIFPSQADSVQ